MTARLRVVLQRVDFDAAFWYAVAFVGSAFGVMQEVSFSPLRLDVPDLWPLVGLAAGFWLMRWRYVSQGWPTGEAARVHRRPWPLNVPGRHTGEG